MELRIERAVPGGRMLARHEGAVVLVAGAIPGELVRVRLERSGRQLSFARVEEVIEPSPDRLTPFCDAACGGMTYAHIAYPAQLGCKRDLVRDAMRRIGRVTIDEKVPVIPSPTEAYRLRARLHVTDGRAGFFLEGTHTLCDATTTRQLRTDTIPVVERVLAAAGTPARDIVSVVVAENISGSQRVVHLESRKGSQVTSIDGAVGLGGGLTGVTAAGEAADVVPLAGSTHVTDTAEEMFVDRPPVPAGTRWVRQAASFFQGNRYLVGPLVRAVLDAVNGQRVLDLYAGVGLFAVALAAAGRTVAAVEGDRVGGRDLRTNAEGCGGRLHVSRRSVEEAVSTMSPNSADTVIVDPPRTGLSPDALRGVLSIRPRRLVYVSCDPATLARDTAEILKAGHSIASVKLFDLFPNTAHVETLVVFSRQT
jgi:23S rRNA (uracil1939-C5)-methyltransferase